MQSTIVKHGEATPLVKVEKFTDVTRELKILPRAKAKSFIKKRALFVVSFVGEDGEEFDFIMRRLTPAEFGMIFGSVLGKSTDAAIRKMEEDDDEEAVKAIIAEELKEQIEKDDGMTIEKLNEDMRDKTTEAIFKGMFQLPQTPEEDLWTREDIDELDEAVRQDLLSSTTKAVTGSGDSVDEFLDMDVPKEAAPSNDDDRQSVPAL